jgi:hypothetical protein
MQLRLVNLAWQQPAIIMGPRLFKFGAQLDF